MEAKKDMVQHPNHYQGKIEVIDYIRDKLTPEGFTDYCCGNVLKYVSRWRKKDGVQDLKKAKVYLEWMIENAENREQEKNMKSQVNHATPDYYGYDAEMIGNG